MSNDIMPCGCGKAVELETYAVCAGRACEVYDESPSPDCGADIGESMQLPHVHILEQSYVYGFTPEEALSRGTMFPELVN